MMKKIIKKMRYRLIIIIFLFLSACTEMDSDLETAINNGYISEDAEKLPGNLFGGFWPATLYHFEHAAVPTNFKMTGDADWFLKSDNASYGSYSLQSGTIDNNQTSCFSITQTTIAGNIVFYYQTSSDSSDNLKFYIDGTLKKTASGVTNWTSYTTNVGSSGSHIFKWCYEKDSGISSGSDSIWIDEILMPIDVETDPPTGSFYVYQPSVGGLEDHRFKLKATDSSGVIAYRFDGSTWIHVAESKDMTIYVTKSFYARQAQWEYFYMYYMDLHRNVSTRYSTRYYCYFSGGSSSCYR